MKRWKLIILACLLGISGIVEFGAAANHADINGTGLIHYIVLSIAFLSLMGMAILFVIGLMTLPKVDFNE